MFYYRNQVTLMNSEYQNCDLSKPPIYRLVDYPADCQTGFIKNLFFILFFIYLSYYFSHFNKDGVVYLSCNSTYIVQRNYFNRNCTGGYYDSATHLGLF